MKFVPNMTKVCKYCHEPILYGEEYVCTETLTSKNDVHVEANHSRCSAYGAYGSIPLSGMGGYGGYTQVASGYSPWSIGIGGTAGQTTQWGTITSNTTNIVPNGTYGSQQAKS